MQLDSFSSALTLYQKYAKIDY